MLALLGLLLFFAATGSANAADAISHLAAKLGLSGSRVGYVLADAETGRILEQRNADQTFLPASVTKLFTAYAAIKILGPDYRFSTRLYRGSSDLYLKGGGDPVLSANDLQSLARQLRASQGGARFDHFYFDDTLMPAIAEVSSNQPIATPYNAGFGALNVDFNRVEVVWARGSDGQPLFQVRTIADGLILPCSWVTFAPASEELPAGAPFVYAGKGNLDHWEFAQRLAPAGNTFLPVRTASMQTALVFRQLALASGLALPPPEAAHTPAAAQEIAEAESPPLTEILRGLLRYSNNQEAELIGLAASRELTGHALSVADSSAALAQWLARQTSGAAWQGLHLENHSGLDPNNRVTPDQLLALLRLIADEPALLAVLPPRDGDGDVADPPKAGNVRPITGKSGTMDYARGLAGFFPARDGRQLAFAIFIFDEQKRAVLDDAMDRRVIDPPPAAILWTRRARSLDDALLKSWMSRY
jgi:serine-type D-Ala-D-Ala carboxypeptidase/endopeptidase (penicillin-binding protein 4)